MPRLLLCLLLAGCRTLQPADADLSGTWDGELVRADETWSVSMELASDGRAVTGTSRKRLGVRSVTWEVIGVAEDGSVRIAESRVIQDDTGDQPTGTWCARSGRLVIEDQGRTLTGTMESVRSACPSAVLTVRRPPTP